MNTMAQPCSPALVDPHKWGPSPHAPVNEPMTITMLLVNTIEAAERIA
jgi:hypothetical protein